MMTLKMAVRDIDFEGIRAAADAIRRGQLVIAPTEAGYVAAADALQAQAVRQIRYAADKPDDEPLYILIDGLDSVLRVAEFIPNNARHLAEKYWPGSLMLVVDKFDIPDEVTGGRNLVAVTAPAHPVAQALLQEVSAPLAAASASKFGAAAVADPAEAVEQLGHAVEVVLDSGRIPHIHTPTIVDVSTERTHVLKVGHIPAQDVLSFMEQMA